MLILLKNLLFTVVVPGTVAVYVPLWIAGARSASTASLAAAIPLLLAGGALYAWCVWDFAHFGRGTPAPVDAPTKLVIRGPYRLVRNPMYLAVLAVILGWAAAFGSASLVAYALAVGTAFHLFIVLYEEPHLRRVFGREYEDYCARAGRWLPKMKSL